MSEGQKGGEFFTPTSIVKLIAEVIEPYHGRIYDPACGSGGMFVQSAAFVERHKRNPGSEISVYGQERVAETARLCKMNLAVHGLAGDIRQGNSYYEDPHNASGKFDFVMANPPFNVDRVDKERLKDDTRRFPFGMPRADNANYLWIQLFYSSLAEGGRSGFVMANSASDARQSELEIRKQMIEAGAVDVMIAIGSNFFYTVTLPCTLWSLDRGKNDLTPNPSPKGEGSGSLPFREGRGVRSRDTVLFIDARGIYNQIDRAHREFTEEQIGLIASLVRLYRGEGLNGFTFDASSYPQLAPAQISTLKSAIENRQYADVPGLCKVATRTEIEAQGWSLNPGRYVGVTEKHMDHVDFAEQLEELNEELEVLNAEARELEERIAENVASLLG
jgi:type I restriction enzyme M protein